MVFLIDKNPSILFQCLFLMPNILDGLGLEGSVLDGLAEWPASTTRKEWFAITRQLIQQTIADMDLDPSAFWGLVIAAALSCT